jgi:hypothetical protein
MEVLGACLSGCRRDFGPAQTPTGKVGGSLARPTSNRRLFAIGGGFHEFRWPAGPAKQAESQTPLRACGAYRYAG